MEPALALRNAFKRYRFVVEIEAAPAEVTEQVPASNAREALRSEIASNLESLRGIRSVKVEPAPERR